MFHNLQCKEVKKLWQGISAALLENEMETFKNGNATKLCQPFILG